MQDLNQLRSSLTTLTSSTDHKSIILAGDFNCPNVAWDTATVPPLAPQRDVQELIKIQNDVQLSQMDRECTREDETLDLVFISHPSLIKSSVSILGISDHNIVVTDFDIKPTRTQKQPRKVYQYRKADWTGLNQELAPLPNKLQQMADQDESVESLWKMFHSTVMSATEQFIPSKLVRYKPHYQPWITREIRQFS